MAGVSKTLTINFSAASTPKNVTLVIKDYSTDTVVEGADVIVTGPDAYSFAGVTDALGKVYLGVRQPGQYTLLATATGYQDSDLDFLANDTFTV